MITNERIAESTDPYLNACRHGSKTSLPAFVTCPPIQALTFSRDPEGVNETKGLIRPATIAVTIVPKAAPITTPTARSTTLPRKMNARKSLSMRFPLGQGARAARTNSFSSSSRLRNAARPPAPPPTARKTPASVIEPTTAV